MPLDLARCRYVCLNREWVPPTELLLELLASVSRIHHVQSQRALLLKLSLESRLQVFEEFAPLLHLFSAVSARTRTHNIHIVPQARISGQTGTTKCVNVARACMFRLFSFDVMAKIHGYFQAAKYAQPFGLLG